jgi:hypothetical protein
MAAEISKLDARRTLYVPGIPASPQDGRAAGGRPSSRCAPPPDNQDAAVMFLREAE